MQSTAMKVLVQNGVVPAIKSGGMRVPTHMLGTILSNLAYYGYTLNREAISMLEVAAIPEVFDWYSQLKEVLEQETGADLKMADYVVYKNFPDEVLSMDLAEYWFNQILIYLGVPQSNFSNQDVSRAMLSEEKFNTLKVLGVAQEGWESSLFASLIAKSTRWSDKEVAQAEYCQATLGAAVDFSAVKYKLNALLLLKAIVATGSIAEVKLTSATDVLRIVALLQDGDISLKKPFKFKKLSRASRRDFIELLEGCSNLEEDFAMRKEQWKRFLTCLHVWDYKAPKLQAAFKKLIEGKVATLNSVIQHGFSIKDEAVFGYLKAYPGVFYRKLDEAYACFGVAAYIQFEEILDKLTVAQLLSVYARFKAMPTQQFRLYKPNGALKHAKVDVFSKSYKKSHLALMLRSIKKAVAKKVGIAFDKSDLDNLKNIKLPDNNQELAAYGPGTSFDIPEEVTFIRSASYWQDDRRGTWFDNGWNFFDKDWTPVSTCCWNCHAEGAVFSGDPLNTPEMDGKACQMIDIYLDKLSQMGIKYAVWSVLCFSYIPYSYAKKVFAALQWGANPMEGNLFEPSRAQMSFELKGDALGKLVAYIDVENRKLVYMDANINLNVGSAGQNTEKLNYILPALTEELKNKPSWATLVECCKTGKTPALFSDKDTLTTKPGLVFKKENPENTNPNLSVNEILSKK